MIYKPVSRAARQRARYSIEPRFLGLPDCTCLGMGILVGSLSRVRQCAIVDLGDIIFVYRMIQRSYNSF